MTRRQLRWLLMLAVASLSLPVLAAPAVLFCEQQSPDANITSLADALWFSCATYSTVGFGDYVAVTAGGRLIAVVLMVSGFVLLGLLHASMAALFVQRVSRDCRIK